MAQVRNDNTPTVAFRCKDGKSVDEVTTPAKSAQKEIVGVKKQNAVDDPRAKSITGLSDRQTMYIQ